MRKPFSSVERNYSWWYSWLDLTSSGLSLIIEIRDRYRSPYFRSNISFFPILSSSGSLLSILRCSLYCTSLFLFSFFFAEIGLFPPPFSDLVLELMNLNCGLIVLLDKHLHCQNDFPSTEKRTNPALAIKRAAFYDSQLCQFGRPSEELSQWMRGFYPRISKTYLPKKLKKKMLGVIGHRIKGRIHHHKIKFN